VEAFLNRLHHPMLASIDLSLDRMHRLLAMIGSPNKRLPPVIHVAGTNGKGSLIANLRAILEQAGYRVHVYTSPHLVHFRERIVLAGKEIEDAYMVKLCQYLAPTLASQPATFFEATTALAFLAFAEHKADVLLLETGMGGRLDATNVIEKPLLTVITPISFDHMEYLGNSITAIAAEKAGILKHAVPCVVGRQLPEAQAVIERKAVELSVPLHRFGQEWSHSGVICHIGQDSYPFSPALAGDFQYDNAATAIACIRLLPQLVVSKEHISQGIASARWPARLQDISAFFASLLPPAVRVVLDGGHNPQGGEMLAGWMKQQHLPVTLICGMIRGKDPAAFLAPLAPYAQMLYALTIPGESNSRPAAEIISAANSLGLKAEASLSLEKALQSAITHAKTPSIIVICGSLYLAGKVLAALERNPHAGV
jgi:dihydrofolate synthase/folylpolyglutamate synthase